MVLFLHKFVNEYVTFGRIRSKFKHLYNIKIWLGFSSFVLFSTMIIIFLLSYFFGVHFIIIESPMNQLVNVFFDILLPIKEFFQMILGMDFSQSFLVFKGYIIRYTYICLRFIGYNFEGLFVFFIVKFILKIWLGYHLIYSFLSVKQDYLQRYKLINTMLFMGILIFFFFRDYFVFFNFVEGKYLNSSEILNVKYFNKRNRTKIMTEYIDKKSFFFNQMVYILSLLKINFDVYESFLHIFYFRNKMYMRYYYFLEKFRFDLLGFYYKNRRPTGKNMKFDYIFNNSNYGRNTKWSKFGYKERLRLYKEYRKRNRFLIWPPKFKVTGGWNFFGMHIGGKTNTMSNREYYYRYLKRYLYSRKSFKMMRKLSYIQYKVYFDERGVSASQVFKRKDVVRLRFNKRD